jgi:peptidoglycan/LPS O-acetylase OafA/YrhL
LIFHESQVNIKLLSIDVHHLKEFFMNVVATRLEESVPINKSEAIPAALSRKLKAISFLLIVLIVIIHTSTTNIEIEGVQYFRTSSPTYLFMEFITGGIAKSAVPLFFVISGYLFFINLRFSFDQLTTKWKRRLKSLVVPYLLWSAIGIAVLLAMEIPPWSLRFHKTIIGLSPWGVFSLWLFNPIQTHFWFIRDLIVLVAISPVIYFLVKRLGFVLVLALAAAMMLVEQQNPIESRQSWAVVSMMGLFFFTLGAYLAIVRPWLVEAEMPGKRLLLFTWFCLIVINIYLKAYYGKEFQIYEKVFYTIGVPALWYNYDLMQKILESRSWLWLSQFSFFVYIAHYPASRYMTGLLILKIGRTPNELFLYFFISPLVMIASCVAGALFLKLFMRPLYLLLSGNR